MTNYKRSVLKLPGKLLIKCFLDKHNYGSG